MTQMRACSTGPIGELIGLVTWFCAMVSEWAKWCHSWIDRSIPSVRSTDFSG